MTGIYVGAGLFVVLILAGIFGSRMYVKWGRKMERGRAAEKGLEDAKDARETAENVHRLSDGALSDELRNGPN